MGIHVAHLVLEALCDTDDHVVDERADSSQAGDLFAHTMVELNVDGVWLGACEADREMAEVLYELA